MYFGTDSAVSTALDNKIYRIDETGKKIWIVDNNIIFCSGNMDISYIIMDKYKKEKCKSTELLKELALYYYDNESLLEIVVGEFKNGKIIVYQISSYNDFEVVEKTVNGNNIGLWTAGIRTEECFDNAYKEIMNKTRLTLIYQNTFDNISFEGIGGQLNVYKLDHNSCNLIYNNNIREKNIKRIEFGNKHLIVAQRLVGQILAGVNLTIDATNNLGSHTFTVDSNSVKISGLALQITDGGLPPSQLDPAFKNSLVNLSTPYNGVVIDALNGLVVTRSDTLIQTTLNATSGIKIQKNLGTSSITNWSNIFSVDTSGNINMTGNLVVGSTTLINSATRTIDFSQFTTKLGTISGVNNVDSINPSQINAGTITASISITSPIINGGTITGATISAHDALKVSSNVWNAGANYGIQLGDIITGYSTPATIKYIQGLTGDGTSNLTISALQVTIAASTTIQSSLLVTGSINTYSTITASTFIGDLNGNATSANYTSNLTGSGTISIGSTGCTANVSGGALRLGDSSGAYLMIAGDGLFFVRSNGLTSMIAFVA